MKNKKRLVLIPAICLIVFLFLQLINLPIFIQKETNNSFYSHFDYFIFINSTDNPKQVAAIMSCVLGCNS